MIETAVERISVTMDEIASRDMDSEQKIVMLVFTHLSMIKEAVMRNGNLRAEFFRNIWMVERVRKAFDQDEIEIFRRVLQEGCEKGRLCLENIHLTADIIHYCLKGLEVPYIYGRLGNGISVEESRPIVMNMVRRCLGINRNVY